MEQKQGSMTNMLHYKKKRNHVSLLLKFNQPLCLEKILREDCIEWKMLLLRFHLEHSVRPKEKKTNGISLHLEQDRE